jgi:hypothetical protein
VTKKTNLQKMPKSSYAEVLAAEAKATTTWGYVMTGAAALSGLVVGAIALDGAQIGPMVSMVGVTVTFAFAAISSVSGKRKIHQDYAREFLPKERGGTVTATGDTPIALDPIKGPEQIEDGSIA